MSDNIEKQLEELSNKILKGSSLESPSLDFTSTIMSQIEELHQSPSTLYKPLLPKQFWITIIVFIIAISVFVFSNNTIEATGWFSKIKFNVLPNMDVPKTVLYAIVFFGVMLFIQIPLLKNYFEKRLAL